MGDVWLGACMWLVLGAAARALLRLSHGCRHTNVRKQHTTPLDHIPHKRAQCQNTEVLLTLGMYSACHDHVRRTRP